MVITDDDKEEKVEIKLRINCHEITVITHKGLKPKLFSTMPWYHDIMQKSSLKSFIL